MMRMRTTLAIWMAVSVTIVVSAADAVPALISAAVENRARPPADIVLDTERLPADTIAFSGIGEGDKVVDLVPGAGYFTRILSKVVGGRGRVYAYVPLVGVDAQQIRAREREAAARGEAGAPNPVDQLLAIQNIQPEYSNLTVLWEAVASLGLPEQVDAVFIADAYQRLRAREFGPAEIATINASLFSALKPGGTVTIIDNADAVAAARRETGPAGFVVDAMPAVIGGRTVIRLKKPVGAAGDKRPKGDPLKNWYGNTFTLGTLTQRSRTIFHHADGTYQEFGMNEMQSGSWFWAADGRNCLLHQFPPEQRGSVTCHEYPTTENAKAVGDMWIEGGPRHLAPYREGAARPAAGRGSIVGLARGYVYPNVASQAPAGGRARGRGRATTTSQQ